MGRAYEVVTGFATAPGAVFTALTMSAGDSLTVKNEDLSKKANCSKRGPSTRLRECFA